MWDTDGLHADQRARLEQSPKTAAGTPDFSLLVDGLAAEREQGTTIDIAWRYLDTGALRLVIIDSPGHEQYTRNMATGASHADVAILLVDARGGVKEQTRRHAAILDLMGVRRVVLAVNKMDLVGWSEARFAEIRVTGSFMLVDAISGASMAGGVVTAVQGREATTTQGAFRLTRDLLARGLGADLPQSDRHADQELRRRANEVAILLRQAGGGVGGCVGPGRHRCGRRLAGADGDPVVRLGRRGALGLVGAGRTEARRA